MTLAGANDDFPICIYNPKDLKITQWKRKIFFHSPQFFWGSKFLIFQGVLNFQWLC